MRIQNMYSRSINSATSFPNTKFIFPKQLFIIYVVRFTNEAEGRVLALISVVAKLLLIPAAGIARCAQLSSSWQAREHECSSQRPSW